MDNPGRNPDSAVPESIFTGIKELGLNYRTASDEDLETYLHNDPDAVRDAMRILEENHLNIFR